MSREAPYTELLAVTIGIRSDADNEQDSMVTITDSQLTNNNIPVVKGCIDLRMGTTEHYLTCATCKHTKRAPHTMYTETHTGPHTMYTHTQQHSMHADTHTHTHTIYMCMFRVSGFWFSLGCTV